MFLKITFCAILLNWLDWSTFWFLYEINRICKYLHVCTFTFVFVGFVGWFPAQRFYVIMHLFTNIWFCVDSVLILVSVYNIIIITIIILHIFYVTKAAKRLNEFCYSNQGWCHDPCFQFNCVSKVNTIFCATVSNYRLLLLNNTPASQYPYLS